MRTLEFLSERGLSGSVTYITCRMYPACTCGTVSPLTCSNLATLILMELLRHAEFDVSRRAILMVSPTYPAYPAYPALPRISRLRASLSRSISMSIPIPLHVYPYPAPCPSCARSPAAHPASLSHLQVCLRVAEVVGFQGKLLRMTV
jgi:hypothetical protein